MFFINHGGKCCGIKTIYGFCSKPDQQLPAMEEVTTSMIMKDYKTYGYRAYFIARPAETTGERFAAYMKHWKAEKKKGILEVVLATGPSSYQEDWLPVLAKHKFKLSTSCYNSNSYNRVYVFHLTRDKEGPVLNSERQKLIDKSLKLFKEGE